MQMLVAAVAREPELLVLNCLPYQAAAGRSSMYSSNDGVASSISELIRDFHSNIVQE